MDRTQSLAFHLVVTDADGTIVSFRAEPGSVVFFRHFTTCTGTANDPTPSPNVSRMRWSGRDCEHTRMASSRLKKLADISNTTSSLEGPWSIPLAIAAPPDHVLSTLDLVSWHCRILRDALTSSSPPKTRHDFHCDITLLPHLRQLPYADGALRSRRTTLRRRRPCPTSPHYLIIQHLASDTFVNPINASSTVSSSVLQSQSLRSDD